jgi:hypothetical protein
MTTKADYTTEEWEQILRLPGLIGTLVVTASMSGPVQVVKEMLSIGSSLAEADKSGAGGELVKAIMADAKAGGRAHLDQEQLNTQDQALIHAALLDQSRAAMAIVRSKAPGAEAQAFKGWLLDLARKVAEAGKEGGFLGFGGTLVNEAETQVLQEIDAALGS